LITSKGWLDRSAVNALASTCGAPAATITVASNPTLSAVISKFDDLESAKSFVALGGGSALDAAKALAVMTATSAAVLEEHLINGVPLPVDMVLPLMIAVPTTSGTGSEVTPWGTLWGDEGSKFSVRSNQLRPDYAILDPELCTSMPPALTLSTGLDAVSHAMEAVWNQGHSPITDVLASQTIALARANLSRAINFPNDIEIRRAMQTASALGGLAMGKTQTAIAHSISYPFTSRLGVPHGLACSFTLAECARFFVSEAPGRLGPIAAGLGCETADIPVVIENWFQEIGIGQALQGLGLVEDNVDMIADQLINPDRAANSIRPVSKSAAEQITRQALRHFEAPR